MAKKKIDQKLDDEFVKDGPKPQAEDSQLIWCANCGERISDRAGTFTGWIVRTVVCVCQTPSPTIGGKAQEVMAGPSPIKDLGDPAKGKTSGPNLTSALWLLLVLAACYATWFVTTLIERHPH